MSPRKIFNVCKRFKGTGVFGLNPWTAVSHNEKLERMVTRETERLNRKALKRRQPLSIYFQDREDMIMYNKIIHTHLNELKKAPLLVKITKNWNVSFTETKITPDLSQVVVLWKSNKVKNSDEISMVQYELESLTEKLCEEINSEALPHKVSKLIFAQDYGMKAENFLSLFNELPVPDDEKCDQNKHTANPTIRDDVLNFHRDQVMDHILKAMEKARAPHRAT